MALYCLYSVAKIAGEPVIVTPDASRNFKITPDELASRITPRTRWLILNAPCNPSGALYTRDELRALADVVRQHPRLMVLSDDIYEKIDPRGENSTAPSAGLSPDMRERTPLVRREARAGLRLG